MLIDVKIFNDYNIYDINFLSVTKEVFETMKEMNQLNDKESELLKKIIYLISLE